MPIVEVLRPVSLKMDGGRLILALKPGPATVTQEAAGRLIAAGLAIMRTPRGKRFTAMEPSQ
jgi:hypothetical protein